LSAVGLDEKVATYMVMLYSPPGTGKTVMMRSIIKALGLANNLPVDSTGVYEWQQAVNFQDGLTHVQWAVTMDDVDHGVAPPASGVKTYFDDVVGLVNNKPYSVEQASVDFKGKVRASPLLLGYLSNFKDARAATKSHVPHAFYRRIKYHVTVKVKPEFSSVPITNDNSFGMLDVQKAKDSNTTDMFILEVSTYKQTNSKSEFLNPPVVMSFPQFVKLLQCDFRSHVADQISMIRTRASVGGECLSCFLPVAPGTVCPCSEDASSIRQVLQCSRKFSKEDYWKLKLENRVRAIKFCFPNRPIERLNMQWMYLSAQYADWSLEDVESSVVEVSDMDLIEELESKNKLDVPKVSFTDRVKNWYQFGKQVSLEHGVSEFQYKVLLGLQPFIGLLGVYAYFRQFSPVVVEFLQARQNNQVDGLVPKDWFRTEQTFKPGIPIGFGTSTFTKDDLLTTIKSCYVFVNSPVGKMHAFCLSHSTILVPTHVIVKGSPLKVTQNGRELVMVPSDSNTVVVPSHTELAVVWVPGLLGTSGIAGKLPQTVDDLIHQFDAVEIYADGLKYTPSKNQIIRKHAFKELTTDSVTVDGDCGALYVARFNDAWKIVGMHFALDEVTYATHTVTYSRAALLSRDELSRLVVSIGQTLQGVTTIMSTVSKVPTDVVLGRFSMNSELWAAQSNQKAEFHCLGQLYPPLSGSTMKTKLRRSIFYDELRALEKEFCGEDEYWRFPIFRGLMIEGIWTSPFTNMFKTQNLASFDDDLMKLAMCDYLSGIHLLDNTGYRTLSEHEALAGVPGSIIHRINLKTSAGPPFNQGKRHHMFVDLESSYLSPDMASIIDAIETVLVDGVPSPMVLMTLKDEAVKPGKMPRVFACMPAAYNIVMKKYGAPWKQFVRAHWEFFESFVGINMTSGECNKLVQYLASVDPTLKRLYMGDIKAMDKSWNDQIFVYVCLVIYVISRVIGLDPERNERLGLGLKHATYSVKNDLMRLPQNPSGNDWTVELNGFNISLSERYVYYRMHGFKGDMTLVRKWFEGVRESPIVPEEISKFLTFRKNVALAHYGDDNAKAFRLDPTDDYLDIWKNELGLIMTDPTNKDAKKVSPCSIDQLSFLKRTYTWSDEAEMYLPPIDKKTLARMLLIKKDSSLSDMDHGAVVLTEFLKESVYHGKDFYDKHYVLCCHLATVHGLENNPYFVSKPYDYWFKQIREGVFQPWSTRPAVPHVQWEDQNGMSLV
jgi:hypothetical protein